jgi:hypothetical protein
MAATLKCDTIQNASSSTANLTLDDAGNATVGNTLVMGSSFKRNRLINGNMGVWQRGTSFSSIATATYFSDRWFSNLGGTAPTYSRSTDAPTGFQYSASLAASSTSFMGLAQRIEAANCTDLAGQTITVSFYAKLSSGTATGGLSVNLAYANSADTFSSTTTIVEANVVSTLTGSHVRYTYSYAMPSQVANGLQLIIFNPNATQTCTILISGVQLEVGSVATPYERQIYSDQLAQCQRYYQVYGGSDGYLIGGNVNAASDQYGMVIFPVKMRASPTATSSGTWTTSNVTTTKPSINTVSASSACVYGSTSSSGNWYFQANSSDDTLTFSAEL